MTTIVIKKLSPVQLVLIVLAITLVGGASQALAQSSSASLALSPSSGTLPLDTTFDVGLYLNTNGAQIDGLDAKIIYEPAKLQAQSISTNLQVFPSYPTKEINATSGRITIQGIAPLSTPYSNTSPIQVATVRLKTLIEATTTLRIDFTPGASTDSNVTENGTNLDILSSVTDATYTISPTATASPPPPGSDLPPGATLTPTLLLFVSASILIAAGIWRWRQYPV